MTQILDILPAGSWPETEASGTFAADYEGRHRRRMMLTLQNGEKIRLELEHARLLQAGKGCVWRMAASSAWKPCPKS